MAENEPVRRVTTLVPGGYRKIQIKVATMITKGRVNLPTELRQDTDCPVAVHLAGRGLLTC